jgi:hypothetical protein
VFVKYRIRVAELAVLFCVAAGPATKPATTAPARVRDGLVNGSVRFLVPADWDIVSRAPDGFSVVYHTGDHLGVVSVLITQQKEAIPQHNAAVHAQMQKTILDWDNQDLKNRKVEVIDPPKVERDDRFMLRVHERFKDGDHMLDVLHIYRGVGLNLVGVTVAAATEDKVDAKRVHEGAALLLMSVNLGAPDPKIIRPLTKKE